MRKFLLLFALLLFSAAAYGQQYPNPPNVGLAANRPVICTSINPVQPNQPQWYFATDTLVMSVCVSPNTWANVGGGGSGTVTSFSAGNLSPLFTTSVANQTTTPALTFSLSNTAAFTLFGNDTSSSAAPSFTTTDSIFGSCSGATNALTYSTSTHLFGCNTITSGVSSFSGDGALLTNSSSTGTVTATVGNAAAHTFWGNNTGVSAAGAFLRLACADLSNAATSCSTDATNASNISSGTLPVSRVPTAIPIGSVGSAGLSATVPLAIASTGVISATPTSPASNSIVFSTAGGNFTTTHYAGSSNAIVVWPFTTQWPISFSKIDFDNGTGDGSNNYDVGFYSLSGTTGTLVCNVGPTHVTGSTVQQYTCGQGTVTLNPGTFYVLATTGNATTALFDVIYQGYYNNLSTATASTSGTLPMNITVTIGATPTSTGTGYPYFALQ